VQLDRVELREISLPLKAPFETSFGRTSKRRILIVTVFDRSGMAGYGECVAMETPFYNHETIDTAWLMTTKYILPLLEAAQIHSAAQVRDALAPIRENRMAKGAVEAAIWDLEAKLAEQPLWRHIGGTNPEITCGVSIGLQESPAALLDKISREIASGYQRIKIKIKPGKDTRLVEAIRQRCECTIAKVHFDACEDGLLDALRGDDAGARCEVVLAGCEALRVASMINDSIAEHLKKVQDSPALSAARAGRP